MKITHYAVLLLMVFGFQQSYQAEGLYIGLGLGNSSANINVNELPDVDQNSFKLSDTNALSGEINFGYEFDNRVSIDLSMESYGGRLYSIDFDAKRLGLGYSLPSDSKFSLFGKTGISLYEFTATDFGCSLLCALGTTPDVTATLDGTGVYGQFGVDYRFARCFSTGLTFDINSADFGTATALKLFLKWHSGQQK